MLKDIGSHIRSLLLTTMDRQIITPPHYVGIESSKLLIVDSFDFSVRINIAYKSAMSAKDFKIESSMDGKTWNTLYTETIPDTSYTFDQKCKFNPTYCKYIRCTALTTYDTRGYSWFHGYDFKIYGTLAGPFLYTNPDAYGIRKKE